MKQLALAFRNLLRNRRRSLATLLALTIGAAAILLFGGYSADIRYGMLTDYVRNGGHLQIQHRDFLLYGNGNPLAYGIADYQAIVDAIREDEVLKPLVTVVSPTQQFGAIAGNYDAGVSRTVVGLGYVAGDVKRMREWDEIGIGQQRPPFRLEGSPPDSAIVGIGVARVLLLCDALKVSDCPRPEREGPASGPALPADVAALSQLEAQAAAPPAKARIELLAGQARGSPNVASLNVVAAENQGYKELDEITVILHLQQAQKLVYGRDRPRATAIMIQLAHTASMPLAAARLKSVLERVAPGKPLAVLDFEQLNPFYTQTLQLFDTIFGFIFALIGGIVLFTVSNTMNAAVVERTAEIGTLRSIGLRQAGVRRLFLLEGIILGCSGAICGVLAALLIAAIVNAMHLNWLPPGNSDPLPLTIRIWGETGMIVGTTAGLIVIAAASAWAPAWSAAKLKIVDALRHA